MVQAPQNVLVLDNGGYSLKVGPTTSKSPSIVPNAIFKSKSDRKRVYVGSELKECSDRCGLFFVLPFERGYLVNWDVEQQIWQRAFKNCNPKETSIVLTDPNYLIPAIKDLSSEQLFEEFHFQAVHKSSASSLVARDSFQNGAYNCTLVVDVGYSGTLIAPFFETNLIAEGVLRINVGGKVLTNQLKEWISYRELNVMEETFVVNECKEDACFVSMDFNRDIEITMKRGPENTTKRSYVLPDFVASQRGHLAKPGEDLSGKQCLTMNIERFTLPEAVFNPSDIGIDQMGVVDGVLESLNRCPENLRPRLAENIVVVGGSSKFPGFLERFQRDLRSLLPTTWRFFVRNDVENPTTFAWNCGKNSFANLEPNQFKELFMTKQEWDETGYSGEVKKFYKTI
ncbi:hypothetical protein WR25_04545 isoform A [Diploscapter pachys]|uniref:Actin-related protein 6 n=1 Tax=Diploscapter pachys TaxID=2018661 RepID=A0A2A2LFV0_9BILA|nr:hypothetical protein WR25_04545 isoform A [Diploscapter pachys]